jgi:hypothetical protein
MSDSHPSQIVGFVEAVLKDERLFAHLKQLQRDGGQRSDVASLAAEHGFRLSEDDVAVLADQATLTAAISVAQADELREVMTAFKEPSDAFTEPKVVDEILARRARFDSIIRTIREVNWP